MKHSLNRKIVRALAIITILAVAAITAMAQGTAGGDKTQILQKLKQSAAAVHLA